jgi:hypothetical protein
MVEDKETVIKKMIHKYGVGYTFKTLMDYEIIKPYLKETDKVNFIKDMVNEISEEFGGSGIGLSELNEQPIIYSEVDGELSQIEYLGRDLVYIDVYNDDNYSHVNEFSVDYGSLPGQILDELVEILINHYDMN